MLKVLLIAICLFLIFLMVVGLATSLITFVEKRALMAAWGNNIQRFVDDVDAYEKHFSTRFYYYGYFSFNRITVQVSTQIMESQARHLIGESVGLELTYKTGEKIG